MPEPTQPFRFEIWRDMRGEYRVRLLDGDEVLLATDGFTRKQSAINAINSLKRNGPSAPVEDNS